MENKITLKNSELKIVNDALIELAGCQAPAPISYSISRNLSKIATALNEFEKSRETIVNGYCERGKKGEPLFITKAEGGVVMRKPVFKTSEIDKAKFATEEEQAVEQKRLHTEVENELRDKLTELAQVEVDVILYKKLSVWEWEKIQGTNASIVFRIDKLMDHEAIVEPKKIITT